MSRNFTMVSPKLWRSSRFCAVSDKARLLHIYLLTCEHSNSAGCFRLPPAYACADLKWTMDEFSGSLAELEEKGLVTFDPASQEIMVDKWFKHSPPSNIKHAIGTMNVICRIECDAFREKAEAEFSETKFGKQMAGVDDPPANVQSINSRIGQTRIGSARP